MTELEAVNRMLFVVGEMPVNTLEEAGTTEVSIALTALREASEQIQAFNLHCNTDYKYKLLPETETGYIYIPDNIISIDPSNRNEDYVRRGDRLYNRIKHTFKFDGPVECDITWELPFEELPSAAQKYITMKAARQFILHLYGECELYQYTQPDEQDAFVMFRKELINSKDKNMLDYNPGFTVARRRI